MACRLKPGPAPDLGGQETPVGKQVVWPVRRPGGRAGREAKAAARMMAAPAEAKTPWGGAFGRVDWGAGGWGWADADGMEQSSMATRVRGRVASDPGRESRKKPSALTARRIRIAARPGKVASGPSCAAWAASGSGAADGAIVKPWSEPGFPVTHFPGSRSRENWARGLRFQNDARLNPCRFGLEMDERRLLMGRSANLACDRVS